MTWAAQGKEYAAWERLSHLLALIYNVNRGKDQRGVDPYDIFHRPGQPRPQRKGRGISIDDLKAMF